MKDLIVWQHSVTSEGHTQFATSTMTPEGNTLHYSVTDAEVRFGKPWVFRYCWSPMAYSQTHHETMEEALMEATKQICVDREQIAYHMAKALAE